MNWIDMVGWTEIGGVVVILLAIGMMVWIVPRGPHQDECEHGVDTEDCPECRGFGQ